MFSAFLDANVLVPVHLCDTLLRCAEAGLYRPVWSTKVVQEAGEAIHRIHPDLSESRITSRFSNMDAAFPYSLVAEKRWEGLISGIQLPDPDDRHVVAAATVAGADVIVTANLKDFPTDELAEYSLESVDPDTLLRDMLDLNPTAVRHALHMQVQNLRRPPMSVDTLLKKLNLAGVPKFVVDYQSLYKDEIS